MGKRRANGESSIYQDAAGVEERGGVVGGDLAGHAGATLGVALSEPGEALAAGDRRVV